MFVTTTTKNGNEYVKISDLQNYLELMAEKAGLGVIKMFVSEVNEHIEKLK